MLLVAVIAFLNLRGVRESGTAFAIPTYAFMASILTCRSAGDSSDGCCWRIGLRDLSNSDRTIVRRAMDFGDDPGATCAMSLRRSR